MKVSAMMVNFIWLLSCLPRTISFNNSISNIKKTQYDILMNCVKRNQDTETGKKFLFKNIKTIKEFQEHVPLSTYEDYKEYIQMIADGKRDVLSRGDILLFEPTGGSTGGSKYIPYNKALKKEFSNAIDAWIWGMFNRNPKIFTGRSYWSISPVLKGREKMLGIHRIGFEDDSDYLGPIAALHKKFVLAVPGEVAQIENMKTFKFVTLLFLLKTKDLSMISIWNPTFLMVVLSGLQQDKDRLINALRKGQIDVELDETLKAKLEKKLGKCASRAGEVELILSTNNKGKLFEGLWPNLRLISCWADSAAGEYADKLKQLFPNVRIEPKGLLSTEGIVSFPSKQGNILAANSHFFEFLKEDKSYLAHELISGEKYEVVLTTGGGLYRYKTGDIVEITGFEKRAPSIIFISRVGSISDIFGEKLNEHYVKQSLEKMLQDVRITPGFYFVAPETDKKETFYTLFMEDSVKISQEAAREICEKMDVEFSDNYHYAYCRKLGQLAMPKIFIMEANGISLVEKYLEMTSACGKKLGDIKPSVLNKEVGWSKVFNGRFL